MFLLFDIMADKLLDASFSGVCVPSLLTVSQATKLAGPLISDCKATCKARLLLISDTLYLFEVPPFKSFWLGVELTQELSTLASL